MAWINENFLKLPAGYLFPEIARRVQSYLSQHPQAPIIRLGIGDVTEPLPPAIVSALQAAVAEQSNRATFRGYGPEQGYDFLRQAIAANDYHRHGIEIHADEIFVSDGSKCDCGNILDIFGTGNKIAIPDPVYPVYVDTNVMAGNSWGLDQNGRFAGITYLEMTAENQFQPPLPATPVDIIYLCFPNNPTGAVASRETLTQWVEYARAHRSIIFFDAAYEAYIQDDQIPHSIYEIPGADQVSIEMRSFSKTVGFTGLRCAFTVIPKKLMGYAKSGDAISLHGLWHRRHTTKFNGVSYPIQQAAAAVYTADGQTQVRERIAFYMGNAKLLRDGLQAAGFRVYGGQHAPYVWLQTPQQLKSWDFFNLLLEKCQVVGTPGSGFGSAGEGYFRLSAFNNRENTQTALDRIQGAF